jgi:Cof subfamily protein (haloacid dehalogenase superfamily)
MRKVDLHVHSTCSDGSLSPSELVDLGIQKGLAAFALTDHDTIRGISEAKAYAAWLAEKGEAVPKIISGIEISTTTTIDGRDHEIHILGLAINEEDKNFQDKLAQLIDSREVRNQRMCELLTQGGFPINYEELKCTYTDCVITRAQFAQHMVTKGLVSSYKEAFERYIGNDCPYYVMRDRLTAAQAIELILEADGIPVLAHPFLYHLEENQVEKLVSTLADAGLLGIETIYSTHTLYQEQTARKLAARYSLMISGGSDFHGTLKPTIDLGSGKGHLSVPESVWLAMEDVKLHKVLFTDLDGTLFQTGSKISPALREGLEQTAKAGHRIVLSSGRILQSVLDAREELGIAFPNMYIIANNGALAYDCTTGTKLSGCDMRLSREDIRHMVEEADRFGLHIQGYTDDAIVCREWDDELRYYTGQLEMNVRFVPDIAEELKEGSYKLLLLHLTDRSRLEAFRKQLLPYCGDRIQLLFSNDKYLEVLPGKAGKGNALTFLQKYLHMPHSHTVAVGDEENDISMIQAAHMGVAMANAPQVVKEHANWVTTGDNNHDGVLDVLKRWFL